MCGNCLCCVKRRDPRRDRRMAMLLCEHGRGVLWHHAASTLNVAYIGLLGRPGAAMREPIGGDRRLPDIGRTNPVSIAPVGPQPLRWSKYRPKPSFANGERLP